MRIGRKSPKTQIKEIAEDLSKMKLPKGEATRAQRRLVKNLRKLSK